MVDQFKSYYNTNFTEILVATPNKPESPDALTINGSPGYQVHKINQTLMRNSPNLTVINDGTSTLYVVLSQDGKKWSQDENPLLPGELRIFYNVYEIRLRSPDMGFITGSDMSGGVYRITEYDTKPAYSGSSASNSQFIGFSSADPLSYFIGKPSNSVFESQTPLGIGATFFGSIKDFNLSRLGFMGAIAISDVASAALGFVIQQSINGTNWDFDGDGVTTVGGTGSRIKAVIAARYARVAYRNGAVAQTAFRIGTRVMIS